MGGLLQDYVVQQAERRASSLALVMGSERLTYAELETKSNQLAQVLREAGCARGDRVCVLADKSPQAIVAMIAALKAGSAYVPVDVASPVARTARVLKSASPTTALVAGKGAKLLQGLCAVGALPAGMRVVALDTASPSSGDLYDFTADDVAGAAGEAPPRPGRADDAAHILFTSGSTGEPKGVVITHRNVRAFIEWAVRYFGTRPGDRISGHPPLHFDLSTFDIYGSFCAGAELHLAPPTLLLPNQLADFIARSELTQWFCVPSTMTYMAKHGAVPDAGFRHLRRVLWCGEVLPTPVLIHWMQRVPEAQFTNLYGPTETTIASSYYTLPAMPLDAAAQIPIGRACDGEELLVFDERLQPPGGDAVGEIYIGGAGLSPGYWRDPEKTRAVFIDDPRAGNEGERLYRTGDLGRVGDDGLVYFLGRRDSQIKSRGYRIELGEVESALNAFSSLTECAVVGVPSEGFEGTSICCAFAPSDRAEVTPSELRQALSSTLPAYMLPSRWRRMDVLPKNVNGKIDRRRLRELFEQSTDREP